MEISFGGVDLPKICGNCGNHSVHGDYPSLFARGGCVGSFGLDMGHSGSILDVGSDETYLDVEVQVGGLDEREQENVGVRCLHLEVFPCQVVVGTSL